VYLSLFYKEQQQRQMTHPFSWLFFFVLILGMIAIDLGLMKHDQYKISFKKAAVWSGVWIGLSLAFCGYIYWTEGYTQALNFITGYTIEKALSLDNLLVFIVIFKTFNLTTSQQHRVLVWGILGAIVFRGIFIALGTATLQQMHWIIYLFGLFLLYSAYKMIRQKDIPFDFTETQIYKLCRKIFPLSTTKKLDTFYVIENGKYVVTPLFLAMVSIELSDIIFAIDSIPAIFAITLDPFIVYTSNIFAILGLRALYFLLAPAIERFKYISDGLAYILGYAGLKILVQGFIDIPNLLSFAVILVIIAIAIFKSLQKTSSD
jgi:tellurite resistance protein TerC